MSKSAQNPHEDLRTVLLKAWGSRSQAERDKFAPGSDSDLDPIDARAVVATEQMAALSGSVQPQELVARHPQELGQQVLDFLAPHFDRTLVEDRWVWTLKSERRVSVLQSLNRDNLPQLLDDADRIPTDAAGTLLRSLLRNGAAPADGPPLSESARLQAMNWALTLRPEIASQLDLQRRKAAIASIFDAKVESIHGRFFGRASETKTIEGFVAEIAQADEMRILRISGIGGIGKSTLLAQVLQPMAMAALERPDAPMIICIDFDRPGMLRGGELELSFELSRQIGLYEPATAEGLSRLRERMARDRAARGEHLKGSGDAAIESASRHSNEFEGNAKPILDGHNIQKRTLLVAIDTLEERQRQVDNDGFDDSMARIFDWLMQVANTWGVKLGAIVSGRTPIRPGDFHLQTLLDLGELGVRDSTALLQSSGLPAAAARKLAKIVGGNPLNLKVAGRHYLTLPEAQRVGFLDSTSAALEGLDAAMRQSMLYKRMLQHIPDPRARSLAHPGLALRRVTAEIIRHVLAQACGLGDMDEAEATTLFRRLGKEIWLVERRRDELIHRPGARRMMIRFMRDDPVYSHQIRGIHAEAVSWYESQPESADNSIEALYHRLMLADQREAGYLVDEVQYAWLQALAPSADDFPDPVRVLLLERLGHKLRREDVQWLPALLRVQWMRDRAEHLVQRGQPELALATWREIAPEARPGPWYAAAVFQSGDWNPVASLFNADDDYGQRRVSYHFLMAFVLLRRKVGGARSLLMGLSNVVWRPIYYGTVGKTDWLIHYENVYFFVMMNELQAEEHHRPVTDLVQVTHAPLISGATTYLRISSLARLLGWRLGSFRASRVLAGAFQPTPSYVDAFANRIGRLGGEPRLLRRFSKELHASLNWPGARVKGVESDSASVLGAWADKFSVAVQQSFQANSLDDLLSPLLEAQRSDNPEWRVPIRLALTAAKVDLPRASEVIFNLLDPWVPTDLLPGSLEERLRRSPRATWIKVIEYLDRCDKLPAFMQEFTEHDDSRLRTVALTYLDWISLVDAFPRGADYEPMY